VLLSLAATFATRAQVIEPWPRSLLRARDATERKKVQRAVAEWADADSIASHVGYGIDLFCSEDKGKSTGGIPSILDSSNRAWLTSSYGVKFATLSELAAMV